MDEQVQCITCNVETSAAVIKAVSANSRQPVKVFPCCLT
jgi:hypothetical protein